jgi:hypothetical protein
MITTKILNPIFIELKPVLAEFTDEVNEGAGVVEPKRDGAGVGLEENNPIYVSLTKEVVIRHNGKTNSSASKNTDSNVL